MTRRSAWRIASVEQTESSCGPGSGPRTGRLASGSLRSRSAGTSVTAAEITLDGTAATGPERCQQTWLKSATTVSGIRARSAAGGEGGRLYQRAVQSGTDRLIWSPRATMPLRSEGVPTTRFRARLMGREVTVSAGAPLPPSCHVYPARSDRRLACGAGTPVLHGAFPQRAGAAGW